MVSNTKKIGLLLKSLIFILFIACAFSICFLFGSANSVSASKMTIDLFDTYEVEVDTNVKDNNGKYAVKFLPEQVGASISFRESFSGMFSLDAKIVSNNKFVTRVNFKSTEGVLFSVALDYRDDAFNTYVIYNGQNAGIHYFEDGAQGNTPLCNRSGLFTEIGANKDFELCFDPINMGVFVKSEGKSFKVWDFISDYCDGGFIGKISSFVKYDVEVVFDSFSEKPEMYLYAINNVGIGKGIVDENAKASITAFADKNVLAGSEYVIPQPIVSDLIDVNSVSVKVKVQDSNGSIIMPWTNYRDDLRFVTDNSSNYYLITYLAENTLGNKSYFDLEISNIKQDSKTFDFNYQGGFTLPEVMGVNAKINIPITTVSSNLFNIDYSRYACLTVKYNGVDDDTVVGVLCNKTFDFTFDKAGIYELTFFYEEDLINETNSFTVEIKSDIVCFNTAMLDDIYLNGTEFEVPKATAVLNEKSFDVNFKVIFPSGACYGNDKFILTENGVYTIVYYVYIDETLYENQKCFSVVSRVNDLFVTDNSSTVIEYGVSNVTNKIKGVKVYTSNNVAVRYSNVINLNNLTRSDKLIELIADVTTIGKPDFTNFVVKLTDIYDSNNVITIDCMFSELANSNGNGTYIKTAATGQTLVGWYRGGADYNWGYDTVHSFIGKSDFGDISRNTIKLYFDYANKSLYSGPTWTQSVAEEQDYKVVSYNDSYFYAKPWEGFTTGEVYLDISISGATSRSVGYTVLSVAGMDLSNLETKTDGKPTITLNYENESGFCDGLINVEYPLFNAYAIDENGNALTVDRKVLYNYGQDNEAEIEIKNGCFKPVISGDYTVIYTAMDFYRNVTEKAFTVHINSSYPDISFYMESMETQNSLGTFIEIPKITSINNAFGSLTKKIEVLSPTGIDVPVVNNKFFADQIGNYTIRAVVEDRLNRRAYIEQIVDVSISDKPVLEQEICLPRYFIAGYSYDLPQYTAIDYSNDGVAQSIAPKIYISDDKGSNRLLDGFRYIPSSSMDQNVNIKYVFNGANGVLEWKNDVRVINVKDKEAFNYLKFFDTDVNKEITRQGVKFDVENSDSEITFINAISARTFKLEMSFDGENISDGDYVLVSLDDAKTGKTLSQITITYNNKTVRAELNGKSSNVDCSILEDGRILFGIKYISGGKNFSDLKNNFLFEFNSDFDGEALRDFPNDLIYVTLKVNTHKNNGFYITAINNQTFSSDTKYDRISPELCLDSFGGSYVLNSVIELYPARSYDVLSEISYVCLTVSLNGTPVKSIDGITLNKVSADRTYSFIADSYGSYIVSYVAKDTSSRAVEASQSKIVIVEDTIAPEIKINGKYKDKYSVGTEISVISAKVSDNLSSQINCQVYVLSPNGVMTNFSNKYKFEKAGQYIIRYYAIDDNGNIAISDCVVIVE